MVVELDEVWPEPYKVDFDSLKAAKSERPFGEAAFELLKEAGIIANLAAGFLPTATKERNQAILGALMLKASKVTKALIAMTAHLGGDRQIALVRELIEALATLHYLLDDNGDGIRFDQYLEDSLISEREFLRTIELNVSRRKESLPIEESMKRSIERTAAAAGMDLESLTKRRSEIGWPNAEMLLKGLGENVYPVYRTGSSVLHSKWLDLLRNHLDLSEDGTFDLKFDGPDPRPQPLYAAGLLMVDVTRQYIGTARPQAAERFGTPLDDLERRLYGVFELHSAWLDDLDAA